MAALVRLQPASSKENLLSDVINRYMMRNRMVPIVLRSYGSGIFFGVFERCRRQSKMCRLLRNVPVFDSFDYHLVTSTGSLAAMSYSYSYYSVKCTVCDMRNRRGLGCHVVVCRVVYIFYDFIASNDQRLLIKKTSDTLPC